MSVEHPVKVRAVSTAKVLNTILFFNFVFDAVKNLLALGWKVEVPICYCVVIDKSNCLIFSTEHLSA